MDPFDKGENKMKKWLIAQLTQITAWLGLFLMVAAVLDLFQVVFCL